uniref:G_PROTEIN_RECEP_F2_3 domain-containing protein n=1 Tax=Schistosoma curassoni TaxID=6186 RepID=A0A183K1C0_9TREM
LICIYFHSISVLPIQSGFQCPTSPYTSCPQGWKLRLEYDACICYRPDQIDAQYNWWGDTSSSSSLPTVSSLSNNQLLLMNSRKSTNITIHNENHNQITSQNFAQNRIYDHQDDLYLIKVNYANSYLSNSSTLGQGIYCPPNWDFYEFNCAMIITDHEEKMSLSQDLLLIHKDVSCTTRIDLKRPTEAEIKAKSGTRKVFQ